MGDSAKESVLVVLFVVAVVDDGTIVASVVIVDIVAAAVVMVDFVVAAVVMVDSIGSGSEEW